MAAQSVSTAVAQRQKEDQVVGWLRRQQDDIAMAAASHVKPSAIVRVTQGALRRNEKLAAAAVANPQSLLYALLDCARLGHEPDTDDYYLVPFANEVTGIEGYKGIIERMFRAGGVSSVVAQVVRQHDRYASRGENTPPLHEYDDFATADERGPMRGAYAYAIFPDGTCSQVIRMGKAEIMEHKAKSRGAHKPDSPWQQWEPSMWKKTVLRALEPYVPTSAEYRNVVAAAAQPEPVVVRQHIDTGSFGGHVGEPIVDAEVVEVVEDQADEQPPAPAPQPAETPSAEVPEHEEASTAAASAGQVQTIARHFKRLGFTEDEREQRLSITAALAGRDRIASTKQLTPPQAHEVAGHLMRCKTRISSSRCSPPGNCPKAVSRHERPLRGEHRRRLLQEPRRDRADPRQVRRRVLRLWHIPPRGPDHVRAHQQADALRPPATRPQRRRVPAHPLEEMGAQRQAG